MQVETSSSLFTKVIQDHLELKERNSSLESSMPIGRYKDDDPFQNHPLFKTEEQARLEETMDGEEAAPAVEAHVPARPGEETMEQQAPELDSGRRSRRGRRPRPPRTAAWSHGRQAPISPQFGFWWMRRFPRGSHLKCLPPFVT